MILAFDTSSVGGSMLVARGGTIQTEVALRGRRQAAELVPVLQDLLDRSGLSATDLTGVVVGEGPGSFTGVRVAAATAKGLAHALGIDLWAVSSLAAGAVGGDVVGDDGSHGGERSTAAAGSSGATPAPRYVLFDARGDRVYGACYRVDATSLTEVIAPHGGTVADVLDGAVGTDAVPSDTVFMGDAAIRHRQAIESAGYTVVGPPHGAPTARALLRALARTPDATPVADLDTWEPRYVRPSNAERGRGL